MTNDIGDTLQESLRQTPWQSEALHVFTPLRGIIKKVYFINSAGNNTQQTVVDITMMSNYSDLEQVPVCSSKNNVNNGYEWTPEPGDNVVVQFLDGRWSDPIVTGYLPNPENKIQSDSGQTPVGKRGFHMRCNKTDVVIDKDGNRITYVNGKETVDVSGNMVTTVLAGNYKLDIHQGNLLISLNTGEANIQIAGDTTITTAGNTKITTLGDTNINTNGDTEISSASNIEISAQGEVVVTAAATLTLDGGSGGASGVVTQACLCAFTGRPHIDYSTDVKASKG